jgi:hypothetical protein
MKKTYMHRKKGVDNLCKIGYNYTHQIKTHLSVHLNAYTLIMIIHLQ